MGKHKTRVEITDDETGEVYAINTNMIVSDLRDILLSKRRNQIMGMIWSKMTEDQQRDEIMATTQLAEDVVRRIVELVANRGFSVIHAEMDNFKVKGGTVTITAKGRADDEALIDLNHAKAALLKIIVADPRDFDQQRETVQPDADEPELDLDQSAEAPQQLDDSDDLRAEAEAQEADLDPEDVAAEGVTDDIDGEAPAEDPEEKPDPEKQAPAPKKEAKADDLTPYQAGCRAREDGVAETDNPHPDGSPSAKDWAKGWVDVDDQIEDVRLEGYEARKDGQGPERNPYPAETLAAVAWISGYERRKGEERDEDQSDSSDWDEPESD